jgi:hypothetical protein
VVCCDKRVGFEHGHQQQSLRDPHAGTNGHGCE